MAKNNRNFNRSNEKGFERKSYDEFNRRANKTFEKRPANVTKTLNLGGSPVYDTKFDQLIDIIQSIPFDKLSVQITMPKSEIYNKDVKGFIVVGYIQSFSISGGFKVTILNKYIDKITDDKSIVVKVRTDRETGEIKMITAFAVESATPINMSVDEFACADSDSDIVCDTTDTSSDINEVIAEEDSSENIDVIGE